MIRLKIKYIGELREKWHTFDNEDEALAYVNYLSGNFIYYVVNPDISVLVGRVTRKR